MTRVIGEAVVDLSAARSGRMIGSAKKLRSSRAKRGARPALRNEDLPAPEAPRITSNRGGAASRRPRK